MALTGTFFRLPVSKNVPWFRIRVPLSKVTYTLEMRYNTRMGRWIFSLLDSIGNPIVLGLPVLQMRNLLAGYPTLGIPPGPILAVDDTGRGMEPGLGSFLVDHGLIYVDPT